MSIESVVALLGFGFLIVSNVVIISMFISRIGSRVSFCEDFIKNHDEKHQVIEDDFKSLHVIKGQLELIVPYILSCNLK